MNDLKNGILDINGFLVTPTTKIEDMENHFGISGKRNDLRSHFTLNGQIFINEGIPFKVDISFKEHVVEIILYPQFPEIAAKYDLTPYSDDWLPYFQELRVIMDEWLEKQLGEPTFKDDDVTEYKFDGILLGTDSYIDDRARDYVVHGGHIDIYYE